jgi:hypothetical protein
MTLSSPDPGSGFTIGYDLGTVGTWVRILIGVIASSALLLVDLTDVSAAFLAQTGGWFVGILAVYTLIYALLAPRVLGKVNPWVSTVLFYGPVLALPYVDALPDPFRVALSLYVTVSIAVVVFVRYGGCEVVGIPSLVVRKRHVVYCPWNTVDLVDKAIQDSEWTNPLLRSRPFKIAAVLLAVAVLAAGANLLGDAFPAVWVILAGVSMLLVGGGILAHRFLSRTSAP